MSCPPNGPERLAPRPGPKFNEHDLRAYRLNLQSATTRASRFPDRVYNRDGDRDGDAATRHIVGCLRSISGFDLDAMIAEQYDPRHTPGLFGGMR